MSKRWGRMEALLERSMIASDEQMNRVERGLEATRQLVQSNSRSLEALTGEIRSLGQKVDLYISLRNPDFAAGNDERQAVITRIFRLQRTLDKISNHPDVDED